MRTNLLRNTAIALGLGVCTVNTLAQAQNSYRSPSAWNNFHPVSAPADTKASAAEDEDSKVPTPTPDPDLPTPTPTPLTDSSMSLSQPVPSSPSPYSQAVSSNWSGPENNACSTGDCGSARPSLYPYFGNASLLFLTLEEGQGRYIGGVAGNAFTTAEVDPGYSTGFEIGAGRYLDCGRYGLGINYMLWNPSSESVTRLGAVTNPDAAYNGAALPGGGASVYADIVATGAGIRATRDLSFQGIEANLFSFGLMGAQRASYAGCGSGSGIGRGLGFGAGTGCGYGGAAGPMVRANSGRVRIMTSHGFRWMQIKDSSELAYNIDGVAGYNPTDVYDNIDIENNLLGYQFGSRLTYCLGHRLDFNVGGKFGIYGNRAEMRHRLGTELALAYTTAGGVGDTIDTESTDNVLATLGELDLGLGYRINNAWTVRGGYRLLGITGVANAVDSYPSNYASAASSGQVHADDSYVLHGGYAGLEFNW